MKQEEGRSTNAKSMSSRLEFKGNAGRLIFYLTSINGLVAIALFLSRITLQVDTALIVFGVVNFSYLVTVISKPFKIIIDQDNLLLEIHYLLRLLKKRKIIPMHGIECSFKYEVRARGGKAKVLKIIYDNKPIAEFLPDYNGWDEKSLNQIFEKLNNLKKLNQSPRNKT